MKLLLILCMSFITLSSFAQDEWWRKEKKTQKAVVKEKRILLPKDQIVVNKKMDTIKTDSIIIPGNIKVVKSSLVDDIVKYKSAAIPPFTATTMEGYRIQLFFDQHKRKIDSARVIALNVNPETTTYVKYVAPNYYLFEGDYRSQLGAEKHRSIWLEHFPTAIVKATRIYLPQLHFPEEDKLTSDREGEEQK